MARFNYNYGDDTVGGGLPAATTERWVDANSTYDVVADAGSPGGKAFTIVKSGAGRPLVALDAADGDNQSILALVEFTANSKPSVYINASGSAGSESGYLAELDEAGNTIRIWEGNSGTFTAVTSAASVTLNAATEYWVRLCRFSNGDITARVWANGTTEPTTWNCSGSDSTHTTGWAGVSEFSTGGTLTVHYISAATDWDVGCEVENADFPNEFVYTTHSTGDHVALHDMESGAVFVVAILHSHNDVQFAEWHRTKEKLYITCSGSSSQGAIIRTDRYGCNREILRTTLTDCFSIDFDYDNSLMYYVTRQGINGDLYKNSDDGGSETTIVSNAINWPGAIYFNADDGLIYIPYDNAVRAYTNTGSISRTYPTLTQAHSVVVDDTHVYAGSWNIAGLWYRDILDTSSSWVNADSTHKLWDLDLNPDRSAIFGAPWYDDKIVRWSSIPVPRSVHRTDILSDTILDTIHSVSYGQLQTEIVRDYLDDPDVHRWRVTAKAAKLSGTGTKSAYGWILPDLPEELIDSDHAYSEAAGGGTIRVSVNASGSQQIPIDVQDFTPASGGYGGGATSEIYAGIDEYEGATDKEVYVFWITGGSQTQPNAKARYGAEQVWRRHEWISTDGGITDLSGNLTLTNNGSSAGSQQKVGLTSRDYDGTNDHVDVPSTRDSKAYSRFAWIRPDAVTSRNILSRTDSAGAGTSLSHAIRIDGSSNAQHYTFDGAAVTVTGSTTLSTGTWYHIVGTALNGGNAKLYVDGAEEGTPDAVGTLWTSGDRDDIGISTLGSYSYFDGHIDLIGETFNQLDSDEVATWFENGNDVAAFWDTTAAVEDGPLSLTPVVSTAVPDEGTVGTTVIIGGTAFTGSTDVQFNGTSDSGFVVDSDNQITATVPAGAASGPITVVHPNGNGVSTFNFTVLPDLPPDGWQIELFQIQVNVGETDIEQVSGTYKEYYTEGTIGTNIDFIPISISNSEESLEWDEGVFRLGSIDVTVQLLPEDYFNSYTNYVTSPFVMIIRDAAGNVVFHGPVDPETAKYNAKNRATAFRVLSWEVLLEAINAPCRSIYETQFSRSYNDADASQFNSTFYIKKTLNGVDLEPIADTGSVMVFDTPAGEHRAVILSNFVDGDDLGLVTGTAVVIYLLQNEVIAAGAHTVTTVGSGGLSFRRLKIEFSDADLYELLEQVGPDDNLLLQVDVNGNTYTMPMVVGSIDTSGSWVFLDDDRQTVKIYFNICSGTCSPATLETDFLDFGSTLSITSNTSADAGDEVRILGADMYGYDGSAEVPFGILNHYAINGGVIQGMFSLPELGVLPYIVDTFVFPSGFDKRFDRWGELPPNLLEALRQLQNTYGTFIRLTPTTSGGLPRVTVTVKDRAEANTTDSVVVNTITQILEWTETAADLTPTAVVVDPHIDYFKPKNSIENVGFYYDGVDTADPATTGKPQNGRVVNITINTSPSYSGDIFFGDGVGVRNDTKLKAIAQKFYEYYKALPRACELLMEGTPTVDLLGKMVEVSIVDDPIASTTFERTFFVTGVIVDTNSNQTTIRGRIGEFTGLTGQTPVAVISGQLIWSDVDSSGDEDVVLSGLNSYDPQGQDLTYVWKRDTVQKSTEAVYQETLVPGEYDIELTVTDPDANSNAVTVVLKVQDVSEDLGDGDAIQARFVNATWNFNEDGDLFVTVQGDEYTKTTNGIKIRTADTQGGLAAAGDTSYNNPQVNLEIVTALATNATKWVRVTLVNDVDGTDSSNVWEFAVTNIASTTALIIPAGLSAPTATADATGVDGEIRADASYIYVKIAGTGWVRAALATF